MISRIRNLFNFAYRAEQYADLLSRVENRSGTQVEFRVAETPIFVERSVLDEMATAGAELASRLIGNPDYLSQARAAIPQGYCVGGETPHPNFLTADFALVRDGAGELAPRLVEIQAFPSVYGYQVELCSAYRETYKLDDSLQCFLGGLDESAYWELLRRAVAGKHDPEQVVLTEVDPLHQKTRPDFAVTARKLGISVVDIADVIPDGDGLTYRSPAGTRIPIRRIYNRAIADELIARDIQLQFDLTRDWDVEWAGHPNWYFLISKFSIPWLMKPGKAAEVVPPAVFLSDFLDGNGREELQRAGVKLEKGPDAVYPSLLLKPLFSFAGKGIQFEPSQKDLEAIPKNLRANYLLQQRMHFVPTIETPHGLTQAEIRILYLWPDDGELTPAISLVRLGRGKMMGVDHNRNQEWVGASAAFYPETRI